MTFTRAAVLALGLTSALHAADTRLVRETEALTPEQERAALHVPPGFEVQLFASEPMINKPINMAFDARGRLWVSSTFEYPYAADKARWSDAQGTRVKDSRDAIKILEDTDGNGKADKVTDFANELNIPTGVLPWHKPEHKAGCIAWSIPNIWYFADTDGDDIADHREILFGPLGYEKDTHGMCSSFRLGLDGWVYATHGFNNTSRFEVTAERWEEPAGMTNSRIPNDERSPNAPNPKSSDSSFEPRHSFVIPHSSFDIPGRRLELQSGNVFRFRPDGSKVERYTSGQVNPFGLAWDRYGNLYSADCHSSPIYQLIRGACYPSFGKPHDGLGFAPVMCQHTHGSTGICGIVYIDGGVWGPEWDDHTFVGNVVTSKVNHDHVTFTGSTPKATEQPDFLTSDDPWFRPVDLQLGPDNALYIADFYNKIIGHYEVPLDHPGRDKERGRIWRVVKKGMPVEFEVSRDPVTALRSKNLTRRYLGMQVIASSSSEVIRSFGKLPERLHELDRRELVGLLWVLLQRGENTVVAEVITKASRLQMEERDREWLFCHLLSIVGALDAWPFDSEENFASCFSESIEGLEGPFAHRAAFSMLSQHPQAGSYVLGQMLSPLDPGWALCFDRKDTSLLLSVKLALRALLSEKGYGSLHRAPGGPKIIEFIRETSLGVPTAESAAYLLQSIKQAQSGTPSEWTHIARHGDPSLLPQAIALAKKSSLQNSTTPLPLLAALSDGLSERGTPPPPELLSWAQELALQLLDSTAKQPAPAWTTLGDAKWSLQPRKLADDTETTVLQSLVKGGSEEESRTGTLKSKTFPAPAKLSLWINGHRGFPKTEAHEKNLVRVVEGVTGRELARAFPPRSDVAQRVEFDLKDHTDSPVRLEVIDGDNGKAYAWLGITGIEPAVVSVNDFRSADTTRESLKTLALMLQHSAPAALREKLAAYLPPRPAPPPLPVSPEQRKQLDALIASRVAAFAKARPDLETGANVFKMNCAACHQIKGEGGLIGPQLDGIGARGAERLCEDILDPNRNVDAHFHLHTLTMKDGSTFAGFLKAELGQIHLLADAAGKEHRISKNDIAKTEVTPISLMPPTFGQTLDETMFIDLMGYLLNEKAGK